MIAAFPATSARMAPGRSSTRVRRRSTSQARPNWPRGQTSPNGLRRCRRAPVRSTTTGNRTCGPAALASAPASSTIPAGSQAMSACSSPGRRAPWKPDSNPFMRHSSPRWTESRFSGLAESARCSNSKQQIGSWTSGRICEQVDFCDVAGVMRFGAEHSLRRWPSRLAVDDAREFLCDGSVSPKTSCSTCTGAARSGVSRMYRQPNENETFLLLIRTRCSKTKSIPAGVDHAFDEPALKIRRADGDRDLVLRYVSHQGRKPMSLRSRSKTFTTTSKWSSTTSSIAERSAAKRLSGIRSEQAITLESAQSGAWYLPAGVGYRLS